MLETLTHLQTLLTTLKSHVESFNEPVSKKEGEVILTLLTASQGGGFAVKVYSNILFGGYKEWFGNDLSKVSEKVLKELDKCISDELEFPRSFLKDVD